MAVTLALAEPRHLPAILAIYTPVVEHTAVSFELAPPMLDELAARVERTLAVAPWLVCEDGGEVLGYAYATSFRAPPAYRWAVETTVYVGERHKRRGVGRGLYTALIAILRAQGFRMAIGGIALPNEGSVRLHEALGFQPVGTFARVGYKLGRWHDVGFWELELIADDQREPAPPLTVETVRETPVWREALADGAACVGPVDAT